MTCSARHGGILVARELRIKVTVDSGQARRNLRGVDQQVGAVGRSATVAGASMGGMISRALGAVAVVDVLRRIGTTAIDMNRRIEDAELRFKALGLSSAQAATHVQDLFQFAQRTPFEAAPIIEASAQLQNFGGEALNTRDNLEALGNAAAGSQSPIERVAFWAGRMFTTLESGKIAIGESTAALLEMGAINGRTRITLEELAKSGASADEVFQALIDSTERFGPALEDAQNSVGGLTSSIADNFGQLLGKLGDVTGAFSLFKLGLEVTNAQYTNFNETLTGAVDVFGLLGDAVTGNVEAWADLKLVVSGTTEEFNEARRDAGRLEDKVDDLRRSVGTGPTGLAFQTTSAEEAMRAFGDEEERITRETQELRRATDEQTRAQERAREEQDQFLDSVTNLGTAVDGQIRAVSMWDVRLEQLSDRHEAFQSILDDTTGKIVLQSRAIEGLDDMMTQRIAPTLENQKGIMESFKDDAIGFFSEAFGFDGGISGVLGAFATDAGDLFGRLFGGSGSPGSLENLVVEGLAALADAFIPGLGNIVRLVAQWADEVWGFISGLFGRIGRGVANLIGSIPGFGGIRGNHPDTDLTSPFPGVPGQGPGDEGGTAGITEGFQHGGFVSGRGGIDALHARLTAGEFVMSRAAVARIGAGNLAEANAGGGMGGNVTLSVDLRGAVISDERSLDRLTTTISDRIVRRLEQRRRIGFAFT